MQPRLLLFPLPILLLTACGQPSVAYHTSTSPSATATASASSVPQTHITVTGGVTGTFENPVSTCNRPYPLPGNQATIAVTATGKLGDHPAQLIILDPTGPADYESQGYAIFSLWVSADGINPYGWTQNRASDLASPPEGISGFNALTGATFAVTLIPNQQFGAPPGESPVTVTGGIRCP